MADPQKRSIGTSARNTMLNLIKANAASNERNHRVQLSYHSKGNQMNSSQQQKTNSNENEKSSPKPLLDCLQPGPLLTSKPYEKPMSQRRRKNRPFDRENLERSNDDQVNKPDISPGKIEIGRSTIDIREPAAEHFLALKNAFDKILSERSLSDHSREQRISVFMKLRQLITDARPDSQVSLYGSVYFECCLEKPGIMDIDVQFKELSQYDTLKESLDIIKKSDLYKDACIDTDYKPSCINLIINEPNMRVKLTSGYNRGIYLSKLIRIYIQFDPRVIKLLRLFRILAKTCNTDKPELGTLHPVVFHVMVIHFLQQLDQPVVPCLHEYAYGIDHVPITLNENQYPEFFNVCKKYSSEWKSQNKTTVELLFLQLLSYYVKTFNTKQFVVSIQTRMPVMKLDKNWHSRKLLVEDPTDIKRSLCQTMQSMRSIDYFRDTLNATLNYFGRKQKKSKKIITNTHTIENNDDDLIVIVNDNDNDTPIIEQSNLLHNSYRLFYKRLPPTVARDGNIKQARVREYYRQTFDSKYNLLPKGMIQLNSSTKTFDDEDENEIQEALEHALENDCEIMEENDDEDLNENQAHLLSETVGSNDEDEEQLGNEQFQQIDIEQKETATREVFPPNEEQQSTENDSSVIGNDTEQSTTNIDGNVINGIAKELEENSLVPSSTDETSINDTQSSTEPDRLESNIIQFSSSSLPLDVKTNGTTTDNASDDIPSPIKLEQILDNTPSTTEKDPATEFFFDFQSENFHAEQGAPYVCTTCNGVGHLKTECPELIVPSMIDLPAIDDKWISILSSLCRQITDRCKPKAIDIENRGQILTQLQKQCQRDYPDCNLHAFGSFYNGFGFKQSDLDVCIVFKDEREHNNDEIIRIMQKILRAMKSSNTFENVQPVLHAKVPIIRSRHRQLNIEIDISLHNMLAIENTRLLKTYTEIDPRVCELGYMIKHLAKLCGIGDASRGTLSSYAYIIMLIHFLQQIQPPVLPVLQQLSDDSTKKNSMFKKCSKWNVYFYDDLSKIKQLWKNENKLTTGALWVELLRFYTEQFNNEEYVVTIRQIEPLLKHEKGWFRQTIAIEDPFELSHNLAGGLSPRNWTIIRRVFIRARQQFCVQHKEIDMKKADMQNIEEILFNIDDLCPTNAPKRCEWCKGPYHIRKRCPKLATLANENEKKKRAMQNSEQQVYMDNHYQDNSYRYWNQPYSHNYNNNNGRHYPKSAPPHQQPFAYSIPEGAREFHNSTYYSPEQQTNNSHRSYRPNNSKRGCYQCGGPDHIRAHCPSLKKSNSVHPPKSSS